MADHDEADARLTDLLASAPREADEGFVARVRYALIAEERMMTARKVAWRKFAVESGATGAVMLVFLLLGRATPGPPSAALPLNSPAIIGFLLLALWVAVAMRPAVSARP